MKTNWTYLQILFQCLNERCEFLATNTILCLVINVYWRDVVNFVMYLHRFIGHIAICVYLILFYSLFHSVSKRDNMNRKHWVQRWCWFRSIRLLLLSTQFVLYKHIDNNHVIHNNTMNKYETCRECEDFFLLSFCLYAKCYVCVNAAQIELTNNDFHWKFQVFFTCFLGDFVINNKAQVAHIDADNVWWS